MDSLELYRQLENELGLDLFRRSKAGVTLTGAGAAFLPEARRPLAQVEKAVTAARTARGEQGGQFIVGYATVGTSRTARWMRPSLPCIPKPGA